MQKDLDFYRPRVGTPLTLNQCSIGRDRISRGLYRSSQNLRRCWRIPKANTFPLTLNQGSIEAQVFQGGSIEAHRISGGVGESSVAKEEFDRIW